MAQVIEFLPRKHENLQHTKKKIENYHLANPDTLFRQGLSMEGKTNGRSSWETFP
jgi:hypothetical protein